MKKIHLLTLLLAAFTLPAAAMANNPEHVEKKANDHFALSDTNNDGFISEEEHQRASDNKFNLADTNKDGKISREEFVNFKKAEKAAWKEGKPKKDVDLRASDRRKDNETAPATPRNNGSAM
jgi:hypothetical protein